MDWQVFELHFSAPRTKRYLSHFAGDAARAHEAYEANMRLGQALMPLLHVFEITLRNSVHNLLVRKFDRADWWNALEGDEFISLLREIRATQSKLLRRRENGFPDKVVAELHFGFWTALFNARHQASLWRTLRLAFPHCPKELRQRHRISAVLSSIRHLRNRVFHHEPLLWLKPTVEVTHHQGLQVLRWIDPSLVRWMEHYDDLLECWRSCSFLLEAPRQRAAIH